MIPSAADLIANRVPDNWNYSPQLLPSDFQDEHPGKVTRHYAFVALSLVAEALEENAPPITASQLRVLYVLAHSEALQAQLYASAKRGRKNPTMRHMSTSKILRGHGSKVGRFVIGTKRLDSGTIAVGYILPSVNSSQQWREKPSQIWIIGRSGDVLKHGRV